MVETNRMLPRRRLPLVGERVMNHCTFNPELKAYVSSFKIADQVRLRLTVKRTGEFRNAYDCRECDDGTFGHPCSFAGNPSRPSSLGR